MPISPSEPLAVIGKFQGESLRRFAAIASINQAATASEIAGLVLLINQTASSFHSAYDSFIKFDLDWRSEIYAQKHRYDAEIDVELRNLLRKWAIDAKMLIIQANEFLKHGVEPAPLEILSDRIGQIFDMLTPDGEFFEGEELDRLTTEAIEEDDKGQTEEFQVMGE